MGPTGTQRKGCAALAIAVSLLSSCGEKTNSGPVLPSFSDVSSAPPVIQQAGEAVVRIGTAGEFATASFISPSGILITNNHVLGVDICPAEGCYVSLTFDYQRGDPVPTPMAVFAVPLAVDVGLDMAVAQIYVAPGGATLSTPHYLTLEAEDPESLLGTHVHLVGHPEGDLKQWTQGEIVDFDGAYVTFSAYSLPGNSGSPILDDDGNMLGILSEGPTSQGLISDVGVNEYSIGIGSFALVPAMSEPLPSALWSVNTETTQDEVVQHEDVYLNAHVASANVGGAPQQVLSSLGAACDTGLGVPSYDSVDDLLNALAPCFDAEEWIECRVDAPGGSGAFHVCPPDASSWQARYENVFARVQALGGQLELTEVSFAIASLAATSAAGTQAAAQSLGQALAMSNAPLDYYVASYLAAFDVTTYQGTNLVDFVEQYKSFPGYAISADYIVYTALWLQQWGSLTSDATLSLVKAFASDPTIDVETRLYVESVLYQYGALD